MTNQDTINKLVAIKLSAMASAFELQLSDLYLVNLKSHKKASKIPFFSMGFSLYQARLYCLAGSVATCLDNQLLGFAALVLGTTLDVSCLIKACSTR